MTLFDERPIRPMLARTGEPFDSKDHVFEVKWDGLRTLVFKRGDRIELQNRNLRDVTVSFPELADLKSSVGARTAILDGEAVVLGKNGTPDFGSLQNRFGVDDWKRAIVLSRTTPVTYVGFDLLHLNGIDLVSRPLLERKERLKSILKEGPHLLFGDHVEVHGVRFFKEASKKGFEGVIAKDRRSPYLQGTRGSYWIKIKGIQTQDCVIVGYTKGEGFRASTFGSLVVAAHGPDRQLRHLTNVGGGFDNDTLVDLKRRLSKLERKSSVLVGPIDAPIPVTWVRPSLVCEVKYMSVTHEGKLRFPRFSRLRTDKVPEDCEIGS
jgi:bifunctional non-homologous end joining protein LigD